MALTFPVSAFMARTAVRQSLLPSRLWSSSVASSAAATVPETNVRLDPLVVCGPSGVGKGTIIEKFMTERGGDRHFGFTVSHTTRAPRAHEVNGEHYHFVSVDEFRAMLDESSSSSSSPFVEYAQVHGNWYGTSVQSVWDVVQSSGKRCLLDIDVQGVQRLKESLQLDERTQQSIYSSSHSSSSTTSFVLDPKYIFIAPPSIADLEARLLGRGTESAETLQRRIGNAKNEVEYGVQQGNFDAIVVNDDLEQAVSRFEKAVESLYVL